MQNGDQNTLDSVRREECLEDEEINAGQEINGIKKTRSKWNTKSKSSSNQYIRLNCKLKDLNKELIPNKNQRKGWESI